MKREPRNTVVGVRLRDDELIATQHLFLVWECTVPEVIRRALRKELFFSTVVDDSRSIRVGEEDA